MNRPVKTRRKRRLLILLTIAAAGVVGFFVWTRLWTPLGGRVEGARWKRVQASPHWRDGKFQNPIPTHELLPGSVGRTLYLQFFGGGIREPEGPLPIHRLSDLPKDEGLRAVWVGHVHWGTFNLAYHDWFEPPERLMNAATGRIRFVIPRAGEIVDVRNPPPVAKWWRSDTGLQCRASPSEGHVIRASTPRRFWPLSERFCRESAGFRYVLEIPRRHHLVHAPSHDHLPGLRSPVADDDVHNAGKPGTPA